MLGSLHQVLQANASWSRLRFQGGQLGSDTGCSHEGQEADWQPGSSVLQQLVIENTKIQTVTLAFDRHVDREIVVGVVGVRVVSLQQCLNHFNHRVVSPFFDLVSSWSFQGCRTGVRSP